MKSIGRSIADSIAQAFDCFDDRLRQIDERHEQIQRLLTAIKASLNERRPK